MKTHHLTLALLAAALAAPVLRAETRLHIGVHLGLPVPLPPPPAVVYAPPPVVMHAPAPVVCAPPAVVYAPHRGYWKEVVVKTWVPERWLHTRDRWGRTVRVCEPGYYTYRTERVWVDPHPPAPGRNLPTYGFHGRR